MKISVGVSRKIPMDPDNDFSKETASVYVTAEDEVADLRVNDFEKNQGQLDINKLYDIAEKAVEDKLELIKQKGSLARKSSLKVPIRPKN